MANSSRNRLQRVSRRVQMADEGDFAAPDEPPSQLRHVSVGPEVVRISDKHQISTILQTLSQQRVSGRFRVATSKLRDWSENTADAVELVPGPRLLVAADVVRGWDVMSLHGGWTL